MSKYQKIVEWVQGKILEGTWKSGDKLPAEYELMELFQVSRQTVRKALEVLDENGDVRSRQGSGTYVADKNVGISTKSKRIALVTTYVDNYIFPKIIQGIEKVLFAQGYQVQIAFTNNKGSREEAVLKDLLTQDLAGIIIETTKSALPNPNMYLYKELQKRNIPIIFMHSGYPQLDIPVVTLQDEVAGREMVQYLCGKGHKKIGGIFKMDDGQGIRRYKGYIDGLAKNGIQIEGRHIVWIDTEDLRHLERIEIKIIERFSECSAIVCYNDQLAYNLVEMFKKHGRSVPEDLSIISVDDIELAKMGDVGLTSIHHPKEKLGIKTGEILLSMIRTGAKGESYEFHGAITERDSVKDLNK